MTRKKSVGENPQPSGAPPRQPEGVPSMMHMDHSWTLQAVMEMHKSVGVLCEKIDRLGNDVIELKETNDALGVKVDSINLKLAWLTGICVGVAGLVAIVWAVVTQVPWDRILDDRPVTDVANGQATKSF